MSPKVIAMGTSAGGIEALGRIFSALPKSFDVPIVVVLHVPAESHIRLDILFSGVSRKVIEATDKMELVPGVIYFAPADYHLQVERDLTLSLNQDEHVWFSRPSIDVLFESVSMSIGEDAIGVLMTGANADGATGLKMLKEAGGYTIVQDPKTAESALMPQSALNLFKPHFVGDLDSIAQKISEQVMEVQQ